MPQKIANILLIPSISTYSQDNHHQTTQQSQCKQRVCSLTVKITWTGTDGSEKASLMWEYLKLIRQCKTSPILSMLTLMSASPIPVLIIFSMGDSMGRS